MRKQLTIVIILALLACALPARAGETLALHVAPWGDDLAEGTEAAPLATIQQALARLRKVGGRAPATIWLRGGEYRLTEAIEINYRDRDNLSIRAWPGEEPVLTGDLRVTDWHVTQLNGRGVWQASLDVKTVRALYAEDGARQNARWPKTGTLTVAAPAYETADKFTNQRSFRVDTAQMPASLTGAIVRMLHLWKDELSAVRGYNVSTGGVSMNRPSALTIFAGDPVWFENVLSEPMAAGEWAWDAAEGLLFYAPAQGEKPNTTLMYIGVLERLMTISGVKNLTIEGISFARSGWDIPLRDGTADFPQAAYDAGAAIYVKDSSGVAFTDCAFRQIGAGCIRLDTNVQSASVTGCTFEEIGAQAIYISGRNTREDGANTGFTIENNRIAGYGRNLYNAAAILLIHAGHADIRHNEISDGTYTAISGGWVWGGGFNATDYLTIENNLIYDIGHGMLSDMGGIYLLGVQRHTVVRGNIIHDVRAWDYGGWGIYLDEGASGILVENNIVYQCSSQGFHQHNGTYNTVRNNIFADNEDGQIGISDKRRNGGTFRLEANLLISRGAYVWYKNGIEEIDMGPNLYYTEVSPFVNLLDELYYIADDPAYADVGFVPWAISVGVI